MHSAGTHKYTHMRCAYIHAHKGFELAHPCCYIVQTHACTRIHSRTHLCITHMRMCTRTYIYTQHAHAHKVCTHTSITRTSAPEQHETAPPAASAAAVAAAGCMLACRNSCCCCCCCCCCMLLREIGLPLIITLASTPSRATQRNTSRGGSSCLFLPPILFLPGPPLQHHRFFSGQPGM